jgi:uracil-DNA glycosylase
MVLSKQAELDSIKAEILKNGIGSELAKTAKNLVFGDGNPSADIVFIGEAPGKNEDEQGLPFVGAAGKFLDEMLASINLKRQQVYITNIVKYWPPNNRDPFPEEKAEFFPYLERQVSAINPLMVVTLGRHSMTCFLPDLQISQVHGQPKRYKGRVYLPLFHPAAALYNGAMRQILMEDFSRIPEILHLIRNEK